MKLRWLGAFALLLAPVACSLLVDTGDLSGGPAKGDGGGSSGNVLDGSSSSGDATSSGNTTSSSGSTTGDSGSDGSVDPSARFCQTIKPSLTLQFCDDFDDRTDFIANGWTLLQGGGDTEKSGLSLPNEPVRSKPHSGRIVQDKATGHGRTRISHGVTQAKTFTIHFKWYRPFANEDPPVAILQGANCAVAIGGTGIYSFCPDYLSIMDLPVHADNQWHETTVTVENHDTSSRFYVTTTNVSNQRADPPLVEFNSIELGQGTNDAVQTIFYDDVWAEGKN